jgi:alpha-ribazole phosphatase
MTCTRQESTILLVRHAHTDMAGQFCGQSNPDLSELGQKQLGEIIRQVSKWPFTAVYSSGLIRARRTAEALASSRGLEVHLRSGLGEIDFGDWEAKSWTEVEAANRDEATRWLAEYPRRPAPNGELLGEFEERVTKEFRFCTNAARNTCVVAVTHAGFIRMAVGSILGISFETCWKLSLECGSITEFKDSKKGWEVKPLPGA